MKAIVIREPESQPTRLDDLEPGAFFKFYAELFIKADYLPESESMAVSIHDGRICYFPHNVVVVPVLAEIKIKNL